MFAAHAAFIGGMILPPTVTAISPTFTVTGNSPFVTITGTNFIPGGTSVTVGGNWASSVSVNTAGTSLTCTFPSLPIGAYTVVIYTAAGSATTSFSFVSAPVITSVDYAGGAVYRSYTNWYIRGTGFIPAGIAVGVGSNATGGKYANAIISATTTELIVTHGLTLGSATQGQVFVVNADGGGTPWFSFTLL